MDPSTIKIEDGGAEGRGSRYDGNGVSFAVFSAHATKIELCLFDADGGNEIRVPLPGKTGDVFHGYVPGLKPGQLYGFRAHGPWDPASGHRFNPNKLLLDPYAREIEGEVKWTPDIDDFAKDSAPFVPKARVVEDMRRPAPQKPGTAWEDTIVYEAHPKGQTMAAPGVPDDLRGTVRGLAHPASAGYLKDLGITALELLPVHAKVHDRFLVEGGRKNYWGYNTLGFFAVTPEYLKTGKREEFRDFVDTMHKAGIEVILDVVYNHTAEGGHTGPTLCFRGLDNASYYRLAPDRQYYMDETGCGNTLNFEHPEVRRMARDSLRYWAEEMGVDGFRFDIAPVLGLTPQGFSRDAPFFREIAADPVLSKLKLIAEPWGPRGYHLGGFPQGWGEWNDRFRDDVRRFWRGDWGMGGEKTKRLLGSYPEFGAQGRAPFATVNLVACHDGMTLHDVVSHSHKKNLANGENNRDGHEPNHSYNHGAEGDTNDPAVIALRERQKRNMLASLFLSQGTPLLLAGDEHGNTQGGNNNVYCQDNPTGWRDKSDEAGDKLAAFTKKLIALRKAFPALRHGEYLHGGKACPHGTRDVTWVSSAGREETPNSDCFGIVLNEEAMNGRKDGARLLVVFNGSARRNDFTLPAVTCGPGWERILDTAEPEMAANDPVRAPGTVWPAEAKSVAVFKLKR